MIGESGGVSTLLYQEQIGRENQIQRDQGASREVEESGANQVATDVASFSAEALELARTAVTAAEEPQQVNFEQQGAENTQPPQEAQGEGSSPAQYLDIRV